MPICNQWRPDKFPNVNITELPGSVTCLRTEGLGARRSREGLVQDSRAWAPPAHLVQPRHWHSTNG